MGSGRHAGKALCPGRGCTTGRAPKLCLGDARAGMGLPWEQMPPDSCKMFSGFETLRKCFNQVAEGGRNSIAQEPKAGWSQGCGWGQGRGGDGRRVSSGGRQGEAVPSVQHPGEAGSAEASRPPLQNRQAHGTYRAERSWAGVNLFELGFLS